MNATLYCFACAVGLLILIVIADLMVLGYIQVMFNLVLTVALFVVTRGAIYFLCDE